MSDLDAHLSAIAAGDADAFGRWIAGGELRLRASLASFAARVDVEAVVQETLLRVWQVAPRIEPDGRPNSLLRFAIRVARNVAVSELRKLGRATAELAEIERAPLADPSAPAEPDPLLRRLIAACREELPNKPAAALAERLSSSGLEPDRVLAERLGMQLNTYLQNLTRARRMLAECLRRQGVELETVDA